MAKRFMMKRIFLLMAAAGSVVISQPTLAAAFQLWEQDGASIGNYHAGVAAVAEQISNIVDLFKLWLLVVAIRMSIMMR